MFARGWKLLHPKNALGYLTQANFCAKPNLWVAYLFLGFELNSLHFLPQSKRRIRTRLLHFLHFPDPMESYPICPPMHEKFRVSIFRRFHTAFDVSQPGKLVLLLLPSLEGLTVVSARDNAPFCSLHSGSVWLFAVGLQKGYFPPHIAEGPSWRGWPACRAGQSTPLLPSHRD